MKMNEALDNTLNYYSVLTVLHVGQTLNYMQNYPAFIFNLKGALWHQSPWSAHKELLFLRPSVKTVKIGQTVQKL